ncbi:hypothetical protein PSZ46_23295, partial [Shigella flexneri]|nr:hypothetical protein [Shigella flexneri]
SENSIALVKRAFAEGYDEKDIAYVVKYSEHLSALGLPVIFDANHLSLLTGFKTHFLYGMANRPDRSYRAFTVAKRDGSAREILAPMPD